MPPTTLREQIDAINVWKRGDQRAPHKPLLLLFALARVRRGEPRLIPYTEVHDPLAALLRDFGPKRKSDHPEMPFWYLRNDGDLWEMPDERAIEELLPNVTKRRNPSSKLLLERNTQAGFSEQAFARLRDDPALVDELAQALLDAHFPASYHDDILDAVGFQWAHLQDKRRPRDPEFRHLILQIYEHRCAICGFSGRLGQHDLALEAAHVRWHCEGEPDRADNGLALCVFHHRMLDRGALGLDEEHRVLISKDVNGPGIDELLLRYAGRPLQGPMRGEPPVDPSHLAWHRREVFRAPARVG